MPSCATTIAVVASTRLSITMRKRGSIDVGAGSGASAFQAAEQALPQLRCERRRRLIKPDASMRDGVSSVEMGGVNIDASSDQRTHARRLLQAGYPAEIRAHGPARKLALGAVISPPRSHSIGHR
jgi:hypothetical protein